MKITILNMKDAKNYIPEGTAIIFRTVYEKINKSLLS